MFLKLIWSLFSRNYRQTCQQLPGLDLAAWQADEEPEYSTEAADIEEAEPSNLEQVSESLIKSAIEKAKVDLSERNRFEYESWLSRKLTFFIGKFY